MKIGLEEMEYFYIMGYQLKERVNKEAEGSGTGGADINALQSDYQKNKEIVVDLLVKNVLFVNLEIPKVVKGDFKK